MISQYRKPTDILITVYQAKCACGWESEGRNNSGDAISLGRLHKISLEDTPDGKE